MLQKKTVYVVDLIVLMRLVTTILQMLLDLILKLIMVLRKGGLQLDMVTDSYCKHSIKDPDRAKRGSTIKIIINSPKSEVPKYFSKFLSN